MDTIKLMEIYLSKLLIRRSLVQVQQGEPIKNTIQTDGVFYWPSLLLCSKELQLADRSCTG